MNKILITLFLGLFLISFASAWSENEFNNSLSSENIRFEGNENNTRWLSIPESTTVTNGFLNLSGYNKNNFTDLFDDASLNITNIYSTTNDGGIITESGTSLYMYSTTDSQSCSYPESYAFITTNKSYIKGVLSNFSIGIINNSQSTTGGNTYQYQVIEICNNTFDLSNAGTCNGGINLYKTGYNSFKSLCFEDGCFNNGTISFIYNSTTENITKYINGILNNTYSLSTISNSFKIRIGSVAQSCQAGATGRISILYLNNFTINGDSIMDSSIFINNTNIWNQTGELNSTNSPQQTSNLATILNNYISTATAVAGYYLVPFIFHSDTAGILEYSNLIFNNSGILLEEENYEQSVIEGQDTQFSINITSGGSMIQSVYLSYDGINYTDTTIIEYDTNKFLSYINISIPTVSVSENISFYWIVFLSDSSIITTSTHNQTVLNINIDNCSSYSFELVNFTTKDEEDQTELSNSTIEVLLKIFNSDKTIEITRINQSFFNTNPARVCSEIDLSAEGYFYEAVVKYSAEDYSTEYYHIETENLFNESIDLYDLHNNESTEFRLTFTGNDFLPKEGVLVFLEREYISEGVYKTVEVPKTDSNGQTVLHMVRNDIRYNIKFYEDGELIKTYSELRVFCNDYSINDCTLNLNAISEEAGFLNYNEYIGLYFEDGPYYNETTRRVTFPFTSYNGTAVDVNLRVERSDIFGNNSVCSNSVETVSGSIYCTVPVSVEDTTLLIYIEVEGKTMLIATETMDNTGYGNGGYIAWFVLLVGLILLVPDDKNMVLIVILISYIAALGLGIVIGGVIGIGSAGISIMILTVLGLWKINKNRTS